jgi:putative membrane protein
MKRTIQGLFLAGSLVLGGTALAQDMNTKDMNAKGGKAMNKGGMAEHQGFMVPADEKAFLQWMHYANQQEIQLGQLAQQNASHADVKSFAQSMVQEHTAADQKLMEYAKQKGVKLEDKPKAMNEMEKKAMAVDMAEMEKLKTMKGMAFDSCYMVGQVGDHDETLGKMMAAKQAGFATDTQLTAMMDEQTQHVTRHRQQAYSVLGQLSPAGMGAGGAGDTGKMDSGHKGHQGGMGTGTGTGTGNMGGTGTGTGTKGGTGTGGTMGGTGTGTTGGATGTGTPDPRTGTGQQPR